MRHRAAKTVLVICLVGGAAVPFGVGVGGCARPPAGKSPAPASMSASSSVVAPPSAPAATTGTSGGGPTPPIEVPNAVPLPSVPVPQSSVASTKTDESWARCHQSYKPAAKDVSRDVASMAAACEKQTKMKLVGRTVTGKQADQEQPQSFPFDAKANHCYRVYAQAVDGIKDLDLVVKDSAGIIVGEDGTDHGSPVVLEDGAVCFTKDDKASIVVSVGLGSGAYALQVWSD